MGWSSARELFEGSLRGIEKLGSRPYVIDVLFKSRCVRELHPEIAVLSRQHDMVEKVGLLHTRHLLQRL